MAKAKTADDGKTQRERFIEAARELGTDDDEDAFNRRLKQLTSAPPPKSVQKRKATTKKGRRS
jgi:hypothetical protein